MKSKRKRIILLLSGGTGTRIGGDVPKQYLHVKGKTVIARCMERLFAYGRFDGIAVVAASKWTEEIFGELEPLLLQIGAEGQLQPDFKPNFLGFSEPGENRALSIYNGLMGIVPLVDKNSIVMIHDAVRPFVSDEQLEACFAACEEHDGAMPVLPMKDTVYLSNDGKCVS